MQRKFKMENRDIFTKIQTVPLKGKSFWTQIY